MSQKKVIKRSVRGIWDQVKALRSERSKLYAPAEVLASADRLGELATELRHLGSELNGLSAEGTHNSEV